VATLAPARAPTGITWGEVVELLGDLPRPDDQFADDLEEIQRSQPPMEIREWPN
jgi:hypothetical protein